MVPPLLMLALLTAPSAPVTPRGVWVVLVRTEGAVPAHWAADLQRVAARAAEENSDIRLVPPPKVGLEDIQLAIGCDAWETECAGKVAEVMDAEMALTLVIDASRPTPELSWTLVSDKGREMLREGPVELPDLSEDGLSMARSQLRGLLKGVSPSVVTIETDIPGATLFIDGQPVGRTPYTLRNLEPGPHKVRLELDGRAPLTREIVVEEGKTQRRAFVLGSTTTPAHDPIVGNQDPVPLSVSTPVAFGVLAAGVGISAASWVLYAVHAALFVTYSVRDGETQTEYLARTAALPDRELASTASYLTYASFVGLLAVGLLTAASGAGLAVTSLFMSDDE